MKLKLTIQVLTFLCSSGFALAACTTSGGDAGTGGSGGSGGSGGAGGASGEPLLTADCDPIGVRCGLPFPSDVYLHDDPDGTNPSGKSVRFGATTLPKIGGRRPIDPSDYYELDGWSVASSPTTYMVGATATGLADPTMLATTLDSSAPTILLNADTGALVPHFVDIDVSADTAEKALLIRPGYILEYSTRYIVAIREVVDASGDALEPTEVFRALRDETDHDDPSVASRRQHYEGIFALLAEAGVERDDLQIAWDFTTGSREGITGKMIAVRDAALAVVGEDGPEYVIEEVIDDPNPMLRHRLILTATVPRYLSEHIHEAGDPVPRLLFDESGAPMQNGTMEMEVLVQIPNTIDDDKPLGVLQNGHGFFGSKNEGRNGYQAMAADGWNWVNVAVDLFGQSSADEDLAAETLVGRPELIPGFVERQIQGHVNQLLAMRMMIGRIARDGITHEDRELLAPSQIDPSVRAYRGDSQGGQMGGVYMSISTDVTRGLLGEPAAGYNWVWQRSVDSDEYTDFVKLALPDSPLDFQIMLQLIQLHWDRSEPSGFIRAMHGDTLPKTPEHHVLMHAGIGDHEVPTIISHSMARSIGVSLIRSNDALEPFPREVFGLPMADAPVSGISGLVEYDFALDPEPLTNTPATAGCNPHDRVRELTPSFDQQDVFFRTGRIEWFCDGICNCDGERNEDRCQESFDKECQ
jgi:hypothetical protein